MSTPRPFRTAALPVPPEAVEQANARLGLKGTRRFRPLAIWDVRRAQSASRTRLYSWIEHPDEDVAATLARRSKDAIWKREDSEYVRDALTARALRDAQAEGLAWTPLLDAVAATHLWPYASADEPGTETYDWPNLPAEEPRELPRFRNVETQLVELYDWIRRESDPEALAELLSFQYRPIAEYLAQHARVIDESLLRMLLRCEQNLAIRLARNPHLPAEFVRGLHAWAMTGLVGHEARPRFPHSVPAAAPHPSIAGAVLLALDATHGVADATWDELVHVVSAWTPDPASRWQRGPANETQRDAAWLALMDEPSARHRTPERLLTLLGRVRHEPERVLQLVRDPNAPAELWLRALRETRVQRVREFLAAHEPSRNLPEIRQVLEQSNAPLVLRLLLVDTAQADWPALFVRLARASWADAQSVLRGTPERTQLLSLAQITTILNAAPPVAAVKWIGHFAGTAAVPGLDALLAERMAAAFQAAATKHPAETAEALDALPDAALALLRPEDLAPLATSEDRTVRMRAITSLSRLRGPEADRARDRTPRA